MRHPLDRDQWAFQVVRDGVGEPFQFGVLGLQLGDQRLPLPEQPLPLLDLRRLLAEQLVLERGELAHLLGDRPRLLEDLDLQLVDDRAGRRSRRL